MVYKNSPHDLCCDAEKVCSAFPLHSLVDKAQVSLMDKSRTLQRVTRSLTFHVAPSEPPKLLIKQRREQLRCAFVTVAPISEELSYLLGGYFGQNARPLSRPSGRVGRSAPSILIREVKNPTSLFRLFF